MNKEIKSIISLKTFLWAFLLALLTAYYTDVVAYTKVGFLICFIISFGIILYYIFSPQKAILLLLIILFTFPVYPRDILTIYSDLQINKDIEFYSIVYSRFLGFALIQWIVLGLLFISLVKILIRFKIDRKFFKILYPILGVWSIIYVGTAFNLIDRDYFLLKEFISDQRYFIILITTTLITIVLNSDFKYKFQYYFIPKFVKILIFIGLIVGLRFIIFIVSDFINQDLKFYFSTQPYLLLPVFLSLVYTNPKTRYFPIYMLIFMGTFNASRGDIIFMILDFFLAIAIAIITFYKKTTILKLKRVSIYLVSIFLFTALPVLLIYLYLPKVYDFLLLKLKFFTEGLGKGDFSHSTLVRIYEFKNIVSENTGNIISFFFGKGFGGYFKYSHYPLPFELNISDYTLYELNHRVYFHPHTFINYTLLKGGLIFFIFYIGISTYIFKKGFSLLNTKDIYIKFLGSFSIFYAIYSLNSFWLPHYLVFTGILLGILININKELSK